MERKHSMFARNLSRRHFVQGLALGAAGLALNSTIGCGGGTSSSQTTISGPSTPVVAQPVRGGTLIYVQSADLVAKALTNTSAPGNFPYLALYDRLAGYRIDKLVPEPELAESWQFSADYTSLTMKVRSGVKFHTGRTMTSEDVRWNIARVADPASASQVMNMAKWVQKVETPDESTVVLHFDQPRPSIFDFFEYLFIVDQETYQDHLDGKRFVGTGAFKFKEWVPGDHFTMVRNPDYWQKDLPYLDEITMKVLPDASTRLMNLQTGTADIGIDIDPRDAKSLESDKRFIVDHLPLATAIWYMGLDLQVPLLADKRVRQAIAYLIDRKRIVDTQLMYGEPMCLPWDKASPAYDPELASRFDYNPAKAKDLLTQAAITGAPSLTITNNNAAPKSAPMAEIMQAELTKLGWKVSVDNLAAAEYLDRWSKGQFRGLWFGTASFMHMNPSSLFVMAVPFRVPNASNFTSSQYTSLITDMLKTGDETQSKKLYRQMNELLLDECFVLPVSSDDRYVVRTSKIGALPVMRSGPPKLARAWKSK